MRLQYQLFFSFLLVGCLLVALMAAISSLSFNRGFIGYINKTERAQLVPLVDALQEGYTQHDNWLWLTSEPRSWGDLLDEHLGMKGRRRWDDRRGQARGLHPTGPGSNAPARAPGANSAPITLDPKLLLADAQRSLLIGRLKAEKNNKLHWQPIIIDNTTVGYLGHREHRVLPGQLDRAFAAQRRRSVALTAVGMVLLSALLSLALAGRLVRPLLKINTAVARIGRGQYDQRVPDDRRDELGDLSRSINTLAKTLESNRGARQQMLAEISHELRTPLAILQGELEAIKDGIINLDHSAIDSLHMETMRLARLVDDLHDLTLSDIGALNYQFEPLDLYDLIGQRVGASAKGLAASSLSIQLSPDDKSTLSATRVSGDDKRLCQMLDNLLQNSQRYTSPGGQIGVQISNSKECVVVTWTDSAPGVQDEQLQRLFDPLYRAETSRHRNTGGAGLGLAIVKKIVEAHSGTVQASHADMGGLMIRITMPLLRENSR